MPSQDYKEFFEKQLKDFSKKLGDVLRASFKDSSINISSESIKELSKAINGSVEKVASTPKTREESGAVEKTAENEIKRRESRLENSIRVLVSALQGSANNIRTYGNNLARIVTQTNQFQLLGATALRDAAGNISKLDFKSSVDAVLKEFNNFGISLERSSQILSSALRANVRVNSDVVKKFLARSEGLGNNIESAISFLSTTTNVLGRNIEASARLGESIIETAKSNKVMADSLLAAVAAFRESALRLDVIFGEELSDTLQKSLASLQARTTKVGNIGPLFAALFGTDFQSVLGSTRLAQYVGVNPELKESDPQRFFASVITGLGQRISETSDNPYIRSKLIETLQNVTGISQSNIALMYRIHKQLPSRIALESALKTPVSEREDRMSTVVGEQTAVLTTSEEALRNFKDAALATAGLTTYFKGLGVVSKGLRNVLYDVNGQLTTFGNILGKSSSLVALSNAASNVGGVSMAGVLKGAGNAAGLGIGLSLYRKFSAPSTAAGGSAVGSLSRGVPKLGGVGAGLFAGVGEYLSTGDISRSLTRGVASGGGFATGAAVGSVLGPIGALVGGLVGSYVLDSVATSVHDALDTDFSTSLGLSNAEIQKAESKASKDGFIAVAQLEEQRRIREGIDSLVDVVVGGELKVLPAQTEPGEKSPVYVMPVDIDDDSSFIGFYTESGGGQNLKAASIRRGVDK